MNALEEQLSLNKEMMLHKQMDYASQFEEKKTAMNQSLEEINSIIQSLDSYVHMLPVVGVGDSVMLGAVPNLYATFPNGYFDAGVSRTDWEAGKILQSLKYNGILGDPIIINLGTNGQCGEKCRLEILSICENRNIFWVNVINDWEVHVNDDLASFADRNAHVHLIDWAGYASGHMEYFISDGIHLTGIGRDAYASFLYQSIYDYYLKEYTSRKEKIENTYYSELNQKTLFYGNDLLINSFSYLKDSFGEENVIVQSIEDYTVMIQDIQERIQQKELPNTVVFVFDSSFEWKKEQLQELGEIGKDYMFYLVSIQDIDSPLENLVFHPKEENLMVDGIHLTDSGNEAFSSFLYRKIKKKD